jgi:hypothetical protein
VGVSVGNYKTGTASDSAAGTSPILILSIGHSVFRTLLETSEREGIDINSLGVALLMLGMGRQQGYVQARQQPISGRECFSNGGALRPAQLLHDDKPSLTPSMQCMLCTRPRTRASDRTCPACGGAWAAGED